MKPDELKAWADRCSWLASTHDWDGYLDAISEAMHEDNQRWWRTNKERIEAAKTAGEVGNLVY